MARTLSKKLKLFPVLTGVFLFLAFRPTCFAASFSYEHLEQMIRDAVVTSIEDTLPLLPKSLRSNFTFVKGEAGGQTGDGKFPRALMFDIENRMIVTFNGSPQHRGFDALEVFQYREETESFELRRILFPRSANRDVVFSQANPASCLPCHGGEDPRPNWLPYSKWKDEHHTAFGAHDDLILSAEEKAEITAFLAQKDSHPRYRHLIFPEGSEYSPYAKNGPDTRKDSLRPNLIVTSMLSRLNARRLARKLTQTAQPDLFRDLFIHLSLYGATEDIYRVLEEQKLISGDELARIRKLEKNVADLETLTAFLEAAGMKPSDWDMSFKADKWTKVWGLDIRNWGYNEGTQPIAAWVRSVLLQSYLADHPEFADDVYPPHYLGKAYHEPYETLLNGIVKHIGVRNSFEVAFKDSFSRRWIEGIVDEPLPRVLGRLSCAQGLHPKDIHSDDIMWWRQTHGRRRR